jgi:hypothetical protein
MRKTSLIVIILMGLISCGADGAPERPVASAEKAIRMI